jgi:hypothetical protein
MEQSACGGRVQDAACHINPTVSGPRLQPIGVSVTRDNWAVLFDDPSLGGIWLVISGDGDGVFHGVISCPERFTLWLWCQMALVLMM